MKKMWVLHERTFVLLLKDDLVTGMQINKLQEFCKMTDTLTLRLCLNHRVKITSIILEANEKKIEGIKREKTEKRRSPHCLMSRNIQRPCIQAGEAGALGRWNVLVRERPWELSISLSAECRLLCKMQRRAGQQIKFQNPSLEQKTLSRKGLHSCKGLHFHKPSAQEQCEVSGNIGLRKQAE